MKIKSIQMTSTKITTRKYHQEKKGYYNIAHLSIKLTYKEQL